MKTELITATCTPLNEDHTLHIAALEAHIEDQLQHGIAGLLVAGTMGLMQLQTDDAYLEAVKQSVQFNKGRVELLVGVGDTSFARTLDRIKRVEQFDIDGVVVLSPYLIKYTQTELIDYFKSLADATSKPLYLYDLPSLTGTRLEHPIVLELSTHPNIRGIKCSGDWEETKQLIAKVGDRLEVIPAQPHLMDELVRMGIKKNLDGIFGVFPQLAVAIVQAAEDGNWTKAAQLQQKLSQLLKMLREKYQSVFGCCEVLLNARGIAGRIAPAPLRRLSAKEREQLLSEPLIQKLLAFNSMEQSLAG